MECVKILRMQLYFAIRNFLSVGSNIVLRIYYEFQHTGQNLFRRSGNLQFFKLFSSFCDAVIKNPSGISHYNG